MVTFQIKLDPRSADALYQLAEREMRGVREEAAFLIKTALDQRGLVPADGSGLPMSAKLFAATPSEAIHAINA